MKQIYFSSVWLLFFSIQHSIAQINFSKTASFSNICTDVVTLDYDNDGDLDLYFARNREFTSLSTSANTIWQNDGLGNFTNIGDITSSLGQSLSAFTLNIQNNNYPDLFTVESNLDNVATDNNNGSFSVFQLFSNTSTGTITTAATSDVDGDGDDDILLGMIGTTARFVNIYFRTNTDYTSFNFIILTNSSSDNINAIAVSDIDGDGDEDVILSQEGNNKIFKNDGTGSYTFHQNTEVNATTHVAVADLDNDGDDDILFTATNGNRVWLNDGNGNFAQNTQIIGTGSDTYKVAFADLNNDGFLDAVFANADVNEIWLNTNNNGQFVYSGIALGGSQETRSVVIDEFNGDSKLDIVFANWDEDGNNASELWTNTSTLSVPDFTQQEISVYPNPSSTRIKISGTDIVDHISIYDLTGKLVKQYFSDQNSYDISELNAGIYFVNIKANNAFQNIKLIKY